MLDDLNVMVVEDEPLIALDLADTLAEAGCAVTGPFAEARAARDAMARAPVDAAVLDVDVRDGTVLPLADELCRRGIPIVFHTGRDAAALHARYGDVQVVPKGMMSAVVLAHLRRVVAPAPVLSA